MKVTLIMCHIGVAGMNAKRPIGDREGSWIGHGIASVGASAQMAGYSVNLIDMRQLSGWDEFESIIKKNPSDVYGISVSSVDHWPALKTILILKRCLPDCRVIVGGIHPSIFPGEYGFGVIDTVVQGEGEIAFVDLLKMIDRKKPLPRIYQGAKPDLDTIPWVNRDFFDYERELACQFAPDQDSPAVTMLAGRGCNFKCSFCQPAENAVFGKPYRMRSVDNVMSEIAYLIGRYKSRSITFWDDTFTFRAKWVEDFCDHYERSGVDASIIACSRADIICRNPYMIERLAEIGVKWFVIGLESGSQRILDLIKKGTTVEQNIQASKICRKYGIKVFGTYMYGLPTETPQEALETARMIDEIHPDFASPFWFTPIPGTDIYNLCKDQDLILDETKGRSIERTGRFQPTIKNINYDYITKLMKGYRGLPGHEKALGW